MPTLEKLKLDEDHAAALIEQAIEYNAYSDEMPEDKKGLFEAANEIVAFCLDLWVEHGVRPDDEEEDRRTAAIELIELLEIVGISFDDDDEVVYGELPEFEEDDEEEGEDEEEDDEEEAEEDDEGEEDPEDEDDEGNEAEEEDDEEGEEPFHPDDYIEEYSELTSKSKIAAFKEYDIEDEDTQGIFVAIYEWENEQDKPDSKVLNWLDEAGLGQDFDENEDSDDEGEEGDDELYSEDELMEMDRDDLKELALENDVEFPKRFTDKGRERVVAALLELQDGDEEDEEDEPEEEEAPAPKKRGRPKGSKNKSNDPDDDDAVDEAVAKDDAQEKKRSKKKADPVITVTVDDEEYELDDALYVIGFVSNSILEGASEITISQS